MKNNDDINYEVNLNGITRHLDCRVRRSMHRRAAFTLAEVLVTLSILGVVAAISIPNIVHNYQKRVAITKVQKAYAIQDGWKIDY